VNGPVPETVEVFVYGTLVPGGRWHDVVAPWVLDQRPAEVRGQLYDTGRGYPAATFGGVGTGLVRGVVLTLRDPAAALAHLDGFEGVEYGRAGVETIDGALVLAYEWRAGTASFVAITGGTWPG
jgi:gamma-glutamylcyclotransferase (GGCT)/AIG2-like uncharacterized protein YtfP